eukprot:gene27961-36829_t
MSDNSKKGKGAVSTSQKVSGDPHLTSTDSKRQPASKSETSGINERGKPNVKAEKDISAPPASKFFKICIRKLPVRNFDKADFEKCLDRLCGVVDGPLSASSSVLQRDAFQVEHFVEGKISRKRGPIYGAGFIAVNSEEQYTLFLNIVPAKYPFIEVDDINAQPEVGKAPNQRVFRIKEKPDRHLNTYETDPEFIAFKAILEKPEEKRVSAELQLDAVNSKKEKETEASRAATAAEKIRNNPLLKYLREKSLRKQQEKKLHKERSKSLVSSSGKGLQVTSVLSKSKKGQRADNGDEKPAEKGKRDKDRKERRSRGRKAKGESEPAGEGKEKEKMHKRERRPKKIQNPDGAVEKAVLVASESALSGGSILRKGTIQQTASKQAPPQPGSAEAGAAGGKSERGRGRNRNRGGGGRGDGGGTGADGTGNRDGGDTSAGPSGERKGAGGGGGGGGGRGQGGGGRGNGGGGGSSGGGGGGGGASREGRGRGKPGRDNREYGPSQQGDNFPPPPPPPSAAAPTTTVPRMLKRNPVPSPAST